MNLKKPLFITALLLVVCLNTIAQGKPAPPDYAAYINKYSALALREMQLYRIPASITLSQGIIESNCGKSPLALQANNHFGIKCQKDWTGETFLMDDDEEQECFRKYNNAEESFRDHSLFLTTRQRYAVLFSLDMTDYKGWAKGLSKCGYATNPNYPEILIRIIEENKLYRFDDTLVVARSDRNEENDDRKPEKEEFKEYRGGQLTVFFHDGYKMPSPADFTLREVSKLGRKVYENNGVPFIFALKNDTWQSLASEFGIYTFQVYKQNDLKQTDAITEGQMLYLEPKKRKGAVPACIVGPYDSMYSIAQHFGVQLKFLYKYNAMLPGDEPQKGSTIYLRKK
ncbi:MAG TPA: glucosaminidase domain-containing protein [Bacteroidales bacterium]|nr:glucosaminidase domain-containing protein [Bacteroidales bacterium]HPT00959.1 glucosaminidase domain-containing protein [Bacteroidales bacterium]